MKRVVIGFLLFLVLVSAYAIDLDNPRIGIRGGVGVDVTLVPAFGGEISTAFDYEDGTWLEFALGYFRAYDKWEGSTSTEETTTNIVLLRANRLYNYNPGEAGTFYFLGSGVGVVNVYWKETTQYYTDDAEGTGGGLILTLGAGQAFNGGFELRLDLPILIVFGGYYGTTVSPMLGVTGGIRL